MAALNAELQGDGGSECPNYKKMMRREICPSMACHHNSQSTKRVGLRLYESQRNDSLGSHKRIIRRGNYHNLNHNNLPKSHGWWDSSNQNSCSSEGLSWPKSPKLCLVMQKNISCPSNEDCNRPVRKQSSP